MTPITTNAAHDTATGELNDLIASWRRHLVAQRMSPATLSTYGTSVRQLARFLALRGMPTAPSAISREHVEAFITDLLDRWKPSTAHNRYRALGSFFRWLVDEGEIRTSPMDRMKPPRLPEAPPPVLREPELKRLLETCAADKTFVGRRDEAILTAFIDTGAADSSPSSIMRRPPRPHSSIGRPLGWHDCRSPTPRSLISARVNYGPAQKPMAR